MLLSSVKTKLLFRPCVAILLLGIVGGIPVMLVTSTLAAAMATNNMQKSDIAMFALSTIPYSLRFVLSIFVDSLKPPFLSRNILKNNKKSWIFLSNALMFLPIISIYAIGFNAESKVSLFICTFLISTLAVLSDAAIDGARIEWIPDSVSGIAISFAIFGYRAGMLIGGALSLIAAHHFTHIVGDNAWETVYLCVYSISFLSCIIGLVFLDTPQNSNNTQDNIKLKSSNYHASFITNLIINCKNSFRALFDKEQFTIFVLFIILYKAGDYFFNFMLLVFLLETGFNLKEIGLVVKMVGLLSTLIGNFLAGISIERSGLYKSLTIFGVLSIVSNLTFILQNHIGYNIKLLYLIIIFENMMHGASMACFLSFITVNCKVRLYSSTKYSLCNSISAIPRFLMPLSSGYTVNHFGWNGYFIFSALLGIPGIILLNTLNKKNYKLYKNL